MPWFKENQQQPWPIASAVCRGPLHPTPTGLGAAGITQLLRMNGEGAPAVTAPHTQPPAIFSILLGQEQSEQGPMYEGFSL